MVYQDQGCKLPWLEAISRKQAKVVAWQLLRIFSVLGPPCILHTDNGREFSKVAFKGTAKGDTSELNEEFMKEVLSEIRELWPKCRLVHGRARHSPSQGGVERLNQTVQRRLNAWCIENKSTRWSIGCKLVQWGISTDWSGAIQDVPYELVFGQKPRFVLV